MKNNIKVSVALVIDSKKRILLQKKDSGYLLGPNKWSLVGGGIEKNESAKDAIKRESKEELGINFKKEDIKLFQKFMFEGNLNGNNLKIEHHIFIINFKNEISDIRVGEGAGFSFFEKKELENLDLVLPTKQILGVFLENDFSL